MHLPNRTQIAGYCHHWLHALNQHSLHAPFIYEFYTKVIKGRHTPDNLRQIESFRKQYLQSSGHLQLTDLGAGSHAGASSRKKIADIARHALTPSRYAALLYRCVRHIQARHVVELGTSLGINTLYLSAASPKGKVFTLEGCPATAAQANQIFQQWPQQNIRLIRGNIEQTLSPLLQNLSSIDFLFLDANHRYEPTLRYYELCKTRAHENSLFVIDDIYWSAEMQKAWSAICQDADVSLSIDLYKMGLVFFRKLKNRQHYLLTF